jgi:oligopeptidase B
MHLWLRLLPDESPRRLTPLIVVIALMTATGAAGASHGLQPNDATGAAPAAATNAAKPPVAAIKPYTVASPHGNRVDDYYWLRDDTRKNPDVLAYLKAENAYADAMLAHVKPLRNKLYEEIVGRIKQDDATVPYLKDGWWYYRRFEAGQEYPVFARRQGTLEAPEQVLLDAARLATGRAYYHVEGVEVSPDNKILAYMDDTVGRRQFTLRFKNLATGAMLPDQVSNVQETVAWAADSATILYVEKDPVTLLGLRVRKHVLGTDPTTDPVVYTQDDTSFYTEVAKTKDDRYLVIQAQSTVSSEMQIADAADPALRFRVFLPRELDHEYQAQHVDGRWVIRTNWKAKNFRLMEARDGDESDRSKWREVVPHRDEAFVEGFAAFRNFVAVDERSGGLRKIRIHPWSAEKDYHIASDDPTFAFALVDNHEIGTDVVRYTYDSLTTPTSTFDFNTRTGARVLLKREPVLGKFDPADYVSEFLWATARDGTKVPVSVVYRKGVKRDGTAPLLQYGYGSYGLSTDPDFSSSMLSFLDRGFVYAIAHVRGGQELGRSWYENGKLLHKQNTFSDFVDVTRFLVKERYADPKRTFAIGGSAGGLLMGAIANQAPPEYKGIIAHVPFVDVITTMLDESIPLTTNEFEEWGNPKQKSYHDYMLAYSPYDQVRRQAYPSIMVTTGLWDSQVQYYEPAKWVAKLRAMKTDSNPLLFRIKMEAGHSGKSGRFARYRDIAEVYSFILDEAGIRE